MTALVNTMFKKQIGVTMEVYVDNIMVKGKQRLDHICNLAKNFAILRKYNMKLNPAKCTFGVSSGRFLRYSKIEKLILALVVTTQKLRPYFQGHSVIVMTKYPLRSVLHSPNASQQALVDFIAEFTPSIKDAATQPESTSETAEHAIAVLAPPNGHFWHLQVDRSSNHQGSGACLVFTTPDDSILEQAIILSFKASNNEVEYETLLAGLRLAKNLTVKKLMTYSDSQLITNQTSGDSTAKHPRMAQYLKKVRE
ncbi:uncharacterized protein [Pyrus communis]|uniref:uncharacterized protein n=1 Tax=Pyrus communis TaxID=23211 RepID=UPI0035C19C1E